jgi:hypothetical protein
MRIPCHFSLPLGFRRRVLTEALHEAAALGARDGVEASASWEVNVCLRHGETDLITFWVLKMSIKRRGKHDFSLLFFFQSSDFSLCLFLSSHFCLARFCY